MRPIVCCFIAAVLFSFSPGPSAPEAQPTIAKIVGIGATPCPQFEQEANEHPEILREYIAWAQGFMSAILVSRPPGIDVGLDLNPRSFGPRSQLEFLREHCRQHSTQDVSDATVELYKRLQKEGAT
jgi:hypothetical protein